MNCQKRAQGPIGSSIRGQRQGKVCLICTVRVAPEIDRVLGEMGKDSYSLLKKAQYSSIKVCNIARMGSETGECSIQCLLLPLVDRDYYWELRVKCTGDRGGVLHLPGRKGSSRGAITVADPL